MIASPDPHSSEDSEQECRVFCQCIGHTIHTMHLMYHSQTYYSLSLASNIKGIKWLMLCYLWPHSEDLILCFNYYHTFLSLDMD